ncbi:MAG TPA: phage portal protein [Arenicellales bacterium]|nr:phage portal protein [Arenicellales bacterium]
MSILSAMFGASQPVSASDHWIVRAIGSRTHAGVFVNEFSALNLPVVYACVSRIANPIGMFPIQIFRRGDDGESVQDTEHPLNPVLRNRPNPYMNARTLKKTGQAHALLWGNGYIEIQRNQRGEAIGLWPLLAWNTWPHRKTDELTFRTVIDGKPFEVPDRNVLHIMDLSLDGYCGLSQIQMSRSSVGLAQAAEQFGEKFFANDARSGGFLQHPGKLGDKAVENIQGSMEEQGGLDNAHRIKVLEEGMKYISTTIPPDDAQFLATREFQISELARVYNVPLFLLQSHEKDTSWGSGLEQMMIAFVSQTLAPWAEAWEQELNWKLFTEAEREQGYFVKFNMNSILRGDMQSRAEYYGRGITDGWMLRSEARDKEDLPPVEGLDQPLQQANMVPANQAPDDPNTGEGE